MAAMACTKFSMPGWIGGRREQRKKRAFSISAQQQAEVEESQQAKAQEQEQEKMKQQEKQKLPRPVEPQVNVKSKNMSREYGGQWLSSVTRHVRIYAAYIDPVTCEFDQTQMDKLTLILDPTNEFLWTPETCNKVYAYFQELVDHYEVYILFSTLFFPSIHSSWSQILDIPYNNQIRKLHSGQTSQSSSLMN